MAEGPQVRLRSQWLHQQLVGQQVAECISTRREITARQLEGRTVEDVFCKGKHIFVSFSGGRYLHNHLKMRGLWRRFDNPLHPLPRELWLGLVLPTHTIANLRGQMLRLIRRPEVDRQLAALGPDVMDDPFPESSIRQALANCSLPITEALLDQSLLCGVGNIARSEALFAARIAPATPAGELRDVDVERLLAAVHQVMWDSFRRHGRWEPRIYGHAGERCPVCGTVIAADALLPSRRRTFFCPQCQST